MRERRFINKRAVAYIRVASATWDEDEETRRQRQACEEITRRFNADIIDEYVDIGASACTVERPGLQRLLRRCATGDIHYAIAIDDAKFSRNATDTIELHDALRRRGTSILTKVSALADELHATLVRVMAELDHHERSERARDTWAKRRAAQRRDLSGRSQ